MQYPDKGSAVLNGLLLWLGFCAGWTLGSVPLTLAGAPFATLWAACAIGFLGAGGAWRARGWIGALLLARPEPQGTRAGSDRSEIAICLLVAAGILGGTAVFILTSDARLLWGAALLGALLVLWRTREAGTAEAVRWSGPQAPALPAVLLLGLGLWLAYILLLRPDADDAFYLNLPAGLATAPHGMLQWDTMYGLENWPVLGSNYRVEALQTLIAALAWATGLSVAMVAHLVLPTIWCFAWAAALSVIGSGLFGRRWWIFAVLAVLSGFVFSGTLQSWGVHGVTRLFHGKAPLILIIVPLIYMVVARADIRGTPLHCIIPVLAGLVAVALGLTANAIYIAPLTLGLAIFAGWVARGFAGTERLWTILAATPAVLAGLWLLLFDTPVTIPPDPDRVFIHLGLWNMFPGKLLLGLMALTLIGAVCAAFRAPQARFLTGMVAGALLFVINPFLWPLYDGSVTGGLNFRLWWALPLPLLFAMLASWGVSRVARPVLPTVVLSGLLAALSLTPAGLLGMDETTVKPSLTKRPPAVMPVVARVRALAEGGTVLAVEDISAWMPTVPDHPPQVYIRQIYLDQNMTVIPAEELDQRRRLANWINAEQDADPVQVAQTLMQHCPALWVVAPDRLPVGFEALRQTFQARLLEELNGYAIYRIAQACR